VLLLVDLDGVVYRGSEPIPGIAELLSRRVVAGDDVVYVTNNSMWYRADYVQRLALMGAPVSADRVVSSPRATALYLREVEPGLERVLALGAAGLGRELADVGFAVVMAGEAADRVIREGIDRFEASGRPGAVVVGLDPDLSWERLAVASASIRAGARFVATNRDPIYPTERGLMPGSGAVVAAVEAASGVRPVSIGKPAPLLLEEAARAVGARPGDAVMIGDGILTDLPAARAVGARCVLMLTGVSSRLEAEALAGDEAPDAIAADAVELEAALSILRTGGRP
jgi:4-nitrophenyl phosphatase